MYTAVSVCITKLTRLKSRKKVAYVYFCLTVEEGSISGLLLRKVDLLDKFSGRAFPFGPSYECLPLSSLSKGVCDRPSLGRKDGGLFISASSSKSESSAGVPRDGNVTCDLLTGVAGLGGGDCRALEATMALNGEVRREDCLECGLVLAEGVWIVGVGVLDG